MRSQPSTTMTIRLISPWYLAPMSLSLFNADFDLLPGRLLECLGDCLSVANANVINRINLAMTYCSDGLPDTMFSKSDRFALCHSVTSLPNIVPKQPHHLVTEEDNDVAFMELSE